jgi:ParB family transcriptional regulator, chromosome partitioning protein
MEKIAPLNPGIKHLAREKLDQAAAEIRLEGWKLTETALDFPYGHTNGLRRLPGSQAPLTDEQARYAVAVAEYDRLSEEHEGADDLPEEVDPRIAELEAEIAAVDERPAIYDPDQIARAGVFVTIDYDGRLKVERGFVRPEDEARKEGGALAAAGEPRSGALSGAGDDAVDADAEMAPASSESTEEEVETSPKLSGLMVVELSAHRTVAMRLSLARNPQAAFLAATHALALNAFYSARSHTCLDLSERSVTLGSHAPGIGDGGADPVRVFRQLANAVARRCRRSLVLAAGSRRDRPRRTLCGVHRSQRQCAEHAMEWRTGALQHADQLAEHLALDMREFWSVTVESFFGKVTKAHILTAVWEAKGQETAQMIAHLKKAGMGAEAERLLQGTGWLPEGLRTSNLDAPAEDASIAEDEELPAFLDEATGMLAIHAQFAGAKLVLNEWAETRADLLYDSRVITSAWRFLATNGSLLGF